MLLILISGLMVSSTTIAPILAQPAPSETMQQDRIAPILIDGLPPLMCGQDVCPFESRNIERHDLPASEDYLWWLSYGPDLDWNGMDDRLQRVMAGAESISPSAIVGPDGRKTVAIVVDFAWHPTKDDHAALRGVLQQHGWVGEEGGAWYQALDSLDAIVVDKVPVSALMDIYFLDGVVVVEMQNVMMPSNDIATRALRMRPSEVYTATAYERGYSGEGVVIAVLDTGVDNEHRSLNDFDDKNDAPDEDPASYDDQKWVAGYDATSAASNPDGSQDPDDGQGHGTHVAGSALGTGGSDRTHMGTAPGAYLVDIKVLTDSGGTNSQASLNGIQWMINNRNTDWGNNASSRGIDVASMSFGSVSSPLNPGDEGDNGTGAEARLVNNATLAGIVCVVAMGNDGSRRVPSPASADGAISIAAANDRNNVNRTNDVIASYSNSGPRLSDGDDDDWDELKPDVTSYGTAIISASAATGPSLPGQFKTLADNEYESLDGTSMATPLVSGIVAIMLQADDSLTPEQVKDILRNSSEQKGSASEPSVSNRWNANWGFGLVDASCALDQALKRVCTSLDDSGVVIDPPPGGGVGDHVDVDEPENQTYHLAGQYLRVSGTTDIPTDVDYVQVQILLEQVNQDGDKTELLPWTAATGSVENWYLDILVQDDWADPDADYNVVYARAVTDEGDASSIAYKIVQFGKMDITFSSPLADSTISGSIEVSGTVEGTDHNRIEYKVDGGDWTLGTNLDPMEEGIQSWSFVWNSQEVEDGIHKLSVRMVNDSEIKTDVERRSFTVDNFPAAPDFEIFGVPEIHEQGLPVYDAIAGTLLEVKVAIRNIGDEDGEDVYVVLNAPGTESTGFPSDKILDLIEEGATTSFTLNWWATEPGEHTVEIEIDPNNRFTEPNEENNIYSFTFVVYERPEQPVLRFQSGAVSTSPVIPTPNTEFKINIRVDNYGQNDATNLQLALDKKVEGIGWDRVASKEIIVIPGSIVFPGFVEVTFDQLAQESGVAEYRAKLSGNGVEVDHSQYRFNITVTDYEVSALVRAELDANEVPLELVSVQDRSLLFTLQKEELHVRVYDKTNQLFTDVLLESNWDGELATLEREDDLVHVAWTRKTESIDGYTLTDIGMTSISYEGKLTPKHYHMQPLKLSEGKYWGLALDEYDDRVVLAGYHRDISTGGSWQDVTSIFTLVSETPDRGTSWGNAVVVLADVDIRESDAQPLAIALGEEYLHIIYQQKRDDVTGIERVGLMYTHGDPTQSSWSFKSAVDDESYNAELDVIVEDDEDILIAAWMKYTGRFTQIAIAITDSSWSIDEPNYIHSPGSNYLSIGQHKDGHYLVYDEINAFGPVTRFGKVSDQDGNAINGLSNIISTGYIRGYSVNEDNDGLMFLISETGSYEFKDILSKNSFKQGERLSGLELLLEPLPGSYETKLIVASTATLFLGLFLMFIIVTLRRSRREVELEIAKVVEDQDNVELMIQPQEDVGPLLAIDAEEELVVSAPTLFDQQDDEEEQTLTEELEEKIEQGEGSARLERRMKRKKDREHAEMFANLPPPMLPQIADAPPLDTAVVPSPAIPLPELSKQMVCPKCSAAIKVKDIMRTSIICPICSATIES